MTLVRKEMFNLKAVNGYYENGRFTPVDMTPIPRRVRAVLVFEELETAPNSTMPLTEHAQKWERFLKDIRMSNEPLGAEFDQAMSERVNFSREFTV